MSYRLGVDVGGTFTDLLLYDSTSGRVWLAKTPSTPSDQSAGVIEGIRLISERAGIESGQLGSVLHGTTVATNAVLERRGARVGLIVTHGFRNILHLAEAWTPGPLFGFMVYDKPEPIAALEDIREVPERVDATGAVVRELDEAATRQAIEELRDAGCESLTVSLINSFADDRHERRIGELAKEIAPELPVSLSSEVMPEFREYERTVTTVVNAYVTPALDRYLGNLRDALEANSVAAGLRVVRSDGGLMSVDAARSMPVHTVLSGPAGGVSGAAYVATRAGFDRIMTFDMGGTSTDVAVCEGGSATVTRETSVGDFPVRAPAVEVESIGAGGGSIAYVAEATGALRVGPQSAGADPGPAAYGRGGTKPTVTDANVVLGHLPPRLLAGAMELDVEAAHAAVKSVADPLGLDVHRAAQGIVDIVNEAMLGALRVVTVQKGRTPSEFALVSFGGAGGLHANALAQLLGCYPVLVPPESGVLSALGFIASDIKNEFSQTRIVAVDDADPDVLRSELRELAGRADEWLAAEAVPSEDRHLSFLAEMRYHRQGFELPVPLADSALEGIDLGELTSSFATEHNRLYGFDLPGGAEIVCLRVLASGRVPAPETETQQPGAADPTTAQSGTHTVWRPDGPTEVPTYARDQLHAGMQLSGFAIVEQYDSTTVILPGYVATVDSWLNLEIRPMEEAR